MVKSRGIEDPSLYQEVELGQEQAADLKNAIRFVNSRRPNPNGINRKSIYRKHGTPLEDIGGVNAISSRAGSEASRLTAAQIAAAESEK